MLLPSTIGRRKSIAADTYLRYNTGLASPLVPAQYPRRRNRLHIEARRRGAGGFESRPRGDGPERNARKGKSYENKRRRRGRPEWLRSPDDTPLRDGNRDRLIGLLTQRAAQTLCYYLSELNPNVYHWLVVFMKEHPIPRDGAWDDVSGESFLRLLLSMPIEHASYTSGNPYTMNKGCGVDPRNIAQRIMEIRSVIAKEMVVDLNEVAEENSLLMRETIQKSFTLNIDNVTSHPLDSTDTV